MPLRRPHRLVLAVLGTAAIGLGAVVTAVPSVAAPTLPVELPVLTEALATELVPAVTEAAGTSLAGVWFE